MYAANESSETRGRKRVLDTTEDIPKHEPNDSWRRRKRYPSYLPRPEFWDRLSEVSLTRNALRELNRRNEAQLSAKRAEEQRKPNPRVVVSRKEKESDHRSQKQPNTFFILVHPRKFEILNVSQDKEALIKRTSYRFVNL